MLFWLCEKGFGFSFLSLTVAAPMPPKSVENGVDGDDEREEEEQVEEDSEEEGEEEEEPRLKYQRMGGSVPSLLASDAATCIAVAERMIALGTHAGLVYILDFLGNLVIFFPFVFIVNSSCCKSVTFFFFLLLELELSSMVWRIRLVCLVIAEIIEMGWFYFDFEVTTNP